MWGLGVATLSGRASSFHPCHRCGFEERQDGLAGSWSRGERDFKLFRNEGIKSDPRTRLHCGKLPLRPFISRGVRKDGPVSKGRKVIINRAEEKEEAREVMKMDRVLEKSLNAAVSDVGKSLVKEKNGRTELTENLKREAEGGDAVMNGGNPTSGTYVGGEDGGYKAKKRCLCLDFSAHLIPYSEAWHWQKEAVRLRHLAVTNENHGTETQSPDVDSVLLLQHLPVFTLGTASTEVNLLFCPSSPPAELFRTERGGEVTFHGPGQLVVYPILNLRNQRMDLHWYLRSLEEVVIRTLRTGFGIEAGREEGLTGVWTGGRKVAAMGIRVSRWIAYHGMALNVSTDLHPFSLIVPCGLNRPVTSIKAIIGDKDLVGAINNVGSDLCGKSRTQEISNCIALQEENNLIVRSAVTKIPEINDFQSEDNALMRTAVDHLLFHFSNIFGLDLVHISCNPPLSAMGKLSD